jgi:hypothetical protein
MEPIVREWKRRQEEILQFEETNHIHCNNVLRAASAIEEMKAFVDASAPTIEAWLQTYLDTNRMGVYLHYWLHHGYENINHFLDRGRQRELYPEFLEQWTVSVPNLLQTEKGPIRTSFQEATEQIATYHRRKNIDQCDVLEILEIHKDKKCESNGWFCWTCEDMEFSWDHHLKTQLATSDNVFVNKKLHPVFLEAMTNLPFSFPADWTPPETHFDIYRAMICTTTEVLEDIVRKRQDYKKDGKTPIQCMKEVMYHVKYHKEWRLDYGMKTEFDYFLCFWRTLPILQYAIDLDVKRCQEIRAMF